MATAPTYQGRVSKPNVNEKSFSRVRSSTLFYYLLYKMYYLLNILFVVVNVG